MLSERQAKILKVIVSEYIKTNQAVSSKRIQELLNIKVSSATIRNDSAALEEMNFLEKQHTSSGRVPSTKGYRYYVDHLMEFDDYNESLKENLKSILFQRGTKIENVLEQASQIISEMTKMTAIVTKQNLNSELMVKKIDLIPLSETMASVIFILSNGEMQNQLFNLKDISLSDLSISIKIFSDCLVDTPVKEIENNISLIRPNLETTVKNYDLILETFMSNILQTKESKKEIVGMKNMLENPEFNDTDKLRKVINIMENMSPFDWFDVSYSSNQKMIQISTKIGEEISEDLSDISIVETAIKTEQGSTMLTLVGPKRVDYSQANQLINLIVEIINGDDHKNE
ncbi:heat inducible transcription repressor [Mesoplasma florum L1]|uniref:Heat-inducible transcription repressor HrcA n=1 Tax=Mesoplasma florum (strain ATCC 33453 / NBRC 100688 / NCTC 11704 / L1) TaxID=265311 RepID=HRCA_MESFL|nr:heat-inducible transcriptional repressor HrcA [Mesoplasma florum]Q6F147.1 RecName: Full=Heat-inducible transcription repressor HrcA [Mesoplasma florum L1]AAT75776.1 heat inducible transcription repressor [Mesoplasma florum L1]ATI73377.1 HrcA family transcriptional regulator [Mesoplasma florum]AVN61776.1 HrcA family transcriptional regulator [Mesoplasma florum]